VLAFRNRQVPADVNYAFNNADLAGVATDLIRRERADIVHVGHSMRVAELTKALGNLGIPYVITLTDFFLMCPKFTLVRSDGSICDGPDGGRACKRYCPEFPPQAAIPQRLAFSQQLLANAEVITAPRQLMKSLFEREFGSLHVRVVEFGLRSRTLRHNPKRYMQGDPIVFCYAGSLNPHKGVHVLIDGFLRVRSSKAFLKLYGRGSSDDYVSSL